MEILVWEKEDFSKTRAKQGHYCDHRQQLKSNTYRATEEYRTNCQKKRIGYLYMYKKVWQNL